MEKCKVSKLRLVQIVKIKSVYSLDISRSFWFLTYSDSGYYVRHAQSFSILGFD
ncbi:hypothetical protein GWK48_09220 [Metallosphaera tengchongensis]|uniref:Uncharacterized protein n=1 Tax=Metallosphaera tengchongensis TaxID=1532350 RepID=A0A6N0NUX2_9CREN|nr:hypothetical protein [Metallosphaera tengchongensis]QKR00532.1 hypothetical protein GWK48_09220 [Metallosphaera tengchongensis]